MVNGTRYCLHFSMSIHRNQTCCRLFIVYSYSLGHTFLSAIINRLMIDHRLVVPSDHRSWIFLPIPNSNEETASNKELFCCKEHSVLPCKIVDNLK